MKFTRRNIMRLKAAASEGGNPRVTGVAYTGVKMRVGWWPYPVIVDVAGMKIPKTVPLLANHENETDSRLGIVSAFKVDGAIHIEGEIVAGTPKAADVIAQGSKKADWQLSIGAEPTMEELVEAGAMRRVNGQEQPGPFYHIKKSVLQEVSVIPVGADTATRMKVSAMALIGGSAMGFKAWVEARGVDIATLGEEEIATLRAEFDAEMKAQKTVTAPAAPAVTAAAVDPAIVAAAAVRAERERVAGIRAACAGEFGEIEAAALASEKTVEQVNAEVLKALRASRPAGIRTELRADVNNDVLEAAVALSCGLPNVEKHYKPEMLERASAQFRQGIGLKQLLGIAARANGYTGDGYRDVRGMFEAACRPQIRAAGFSTVSITGILSNTGNKSLLEAFNAVEGAWREISAIRNVVDFKTVTAYRMTGGAEYVLVPPGGEIQHATLGEESFTNKADTYGRMFAITRNDIINDDLGALNDITRRLGRGAAVKLNSVFWTAFMDNASFFTGTGKYISGATTNLGIDGLTTGEAAFLNKTDADGYPLALTPRILLAPPALSAIAAQLFNSTELRDTTASTKFPTSNPHAGKFRPVISSYLSNARYTGYSVLKWYLLADPADLATIETCFLNGQQSPTIESSDADFSTLGIQFRGYHDFGVAKQDARGGLMSKGQA